MIKRDGHSFSFPTLFGKLLMAGLVCSLLFNSTVSSAVENSGTETTGPKFIGASGCSASNCHGGASELHRQNTVWSKLDFHSRASATLLTARSQRIAEALKIKQPELDQRCSECHAPLQGIPAALKDSSVRMNEGVSCESCHGAAEPWLRSHTRTDYTHADRVQAGMRDLKDLYTRANTCVACHQHVDAELLKAGHPELIFELDGQTVSEPRHWREAVAFSGAQTWLIGQATALRETSWHLSQTPSPNENAVARWEALVWVLSKATPQGQSWPTLPASGTTHSTDQIKGVQKAADLLAKQAAQSWPKDTTANLLRTLAGTHGEFEQTKISQLVLARRAELLVLGLDRLTLALNSTTIPPESSRRLNVLFNDVQVLSDFNPRQFSQHLQEFSKTIAP